MLQRRQISSPDDPYFAPAWEIYTVSFPENEKRALTGQHCIFQHPNYTMNIWLDAGRVVGLMGWWEYPEFRFIEHFAIKANFRNRGWGKTILQLWLKESDKPVILEIDPITDTASLRRLTFYKRMRFIENDFEHLMPPYSSTHAPAHLRILSYPRTLTQEQYEHFATIQKEDIAKYTCKQHGETI